LSSLVGITQRPNEVIAHGDFGGRDDEQAIFILKAVIGQWLNVKACSVYRYLHLARHKAYAIPELLRYYQSACLVYG
jgi:hypothetical protein